LKIVHGISDFRAPSPVVAIGNFDGLHLGHQAILSKTVASARERGGTSITLTFDPHPVQFFHPEQTLKRLSIQDEKFQQIAALGMDILYVIPFDLKFASQTPEQFVREYLHKKISVCELVVGSDFAFGGNRAGGAQFLIQIGSTLGFDVWIQPVVSVKGIPVRSSAIRAFIAQGEMRQVEQMLGRYYSVAGEVFPGHQRGRQLGYPTANLSLPDVLIPADGIYAASITIDGETPERGHGGVVYIGTQPTFHQTGPCFEVHLFDWDPNQDLYGKYLRVHIIERIRGDEVFPDLDTLIHQIGCDLVAAKGILKGASKNLPVPS